MSQVFGAVGSASVDIYAISRFFSPQKNQNQIVLDHGSQLWLDDSVQEPSGAGLLSAMVFARQGLETHLVTRTGADVFSGIIDNVAQKESISINSSHESNKHHTDTTIHLASDGQDQTNLHFTGSFSSLTKADCSELPVVLDWLHIATLPADKSVLLHLLKIAKASHAKVSINPRFVDSISSKLLMKTLKQCSLVVINIDEARILTGEHLEIEDLAQGLNLAGIDHIVVYDPSAGAVAIENGKIYSTDQTKQSHQYDNTGAEVVFAAGYSCEYAKNADVTLALTFGLAQAQSVQTVAGARSAILQKPVLEPINVDEDFLTEEIG